MTTDGTTNRISLCMIVQNEEKNLDRCLASAVNVVDEIIIVDTGSTDQTIDIALKFGVRVLHYKWNDNFAAARNYSLQHATGNWILVLDADEYLEDITSDIIRELTADPDAADVYLIPLKNLMIPEHGEWQTTLVLRLFRNSPDLRYQGKIHEQIIVPADKRVRYSEKGPNIIHLGYLDKQRQKKNRRNMEMLTRALAAEPTNPYYHFYISTEYIIKKDFKTAATHIRKALAGISRDILLFRVAVIRNAVICMTALGNLDEAEMLLKSEIEKSPDFPDYFHYLGNVYREKGEYFKAITSYNHALNISSPPLIGCSIAGSNGFKSLFYRGLCQENLRQYFEAIDSFRAAMAENPSFDIPLPNLLKCLLNVGGEDECLRYLAREFTIVSPGLHLLVARCLFAGGCPKAARSYAYKTRDSETDYQTSLLLGELQLAEDNPEKAIAFFKRIPEDNIHFNTSIIYRILCMWKMGFPADNTLLQKISGEPGQIIVKILDFVNHAVNGPKMPPPKIANKKEKERYIKFGREILTKLLELKLYRQAKLLDSWLISIEPSLTWELFFEYRKSGSIDLSERLQSLQNMTDCNILSYLDSAKVFEKLSEEFLAKVPALPKLF